MGHATSRRRGPAWIVVAVLAVAVAVALGSATPRASADSPATAVLDWNAHTLDAISNAPNAAVVGAGQTPPVQGLHLAMVQGAVYDAVNAIDRGHKPYLNVPPAPKTASLSAAVATAAHGVLAGVPGEPGILDQQPVCTANCTATSYVAATRDAIKTRLDGILAAALAAANDGNVAQGSAAGLAAATAMLDLRDDDGRYPAVPAPFTEGTNAGQWRPTSGVNDPFGWVRNVRPFVVQNAMQFISKGPLALTSSSYAKEYNEVKAVGEAGPGHRTPEQQALADFYTANPVEMFHRSFRAYVAGKGLDVAQQARFYARLGLAGADAFITCWADKERWRFWRPITAIQNGDSDGNALTSGQANWTSLVPSPPYPDHSSGYNCITGALMKSAEQAFGREATTFLVVRTPAGPTRQYAHFEDVWHDTVDARVYLGIHFRKADVDGAKIGHDVAVWVDKHTLRRR
jgi:hypothetical protein